MMAADRIGRYAVGEYERREVTYLGAFTGGALAGRSLAELRPHLEALGGGGTTGFR